mgnify:CR=1 FL=1
MSDSDSDNEEIQESTIEQIQEYITYSISCTYIESYITTDKPTKQQLKFAIHKGQEQHIEHLIDELNDLYRKPDDDKEDCGKTCTDKICFCGSV